MHSETRCHALYDHIFRDCVEAGFERGGLSKHHSSADENPRAGVYSLSV